MTEVAETTGSRRDQRWVLQLCHGYDGPFMDCARQYATLFDRSRYKVCTVYLTGAPSPEVERGSASEKVIFLDYSSRQLRGLKIRAIREVRRILSLHDFEFVIAHRFKPIYIALLATSLPVVGVHHAFGVYSRQSRRWLINRFRSRLLLLGVSDAVRDDIRQCLPGWPGKQVQTLYNRIDAEQVRQEQLPASAAREALELPLDAWIIGNVGRLHPDKDQATLIRGFAQALPELPESSLLVIMGRGRLESSLKALVSDLGIEEKVRFLGQIPQGRRYFRAFDVFALTSDHEPFGMVLLEAMAADVPLICANCGGGAEVVEGVGQVFAFGDPKDLSRCLVDQARGVLASPSFDEALQRFGDPAAKRAFKRILQEAWGG